MKKSVEQQMALIEKIADAFHIGSEARTPATIMANVVNVIRRSDCLSAIEREFFTTIVEDEDGEKGEECSLNWGSSPDEYVEQFRAALAAWNSRPASADVVSVPREPTDAMYHAALDYLGRKGTAWYANDLYKAMLAARPQEGK